MKITKLIRSLLCSTMIAVSSFLPVYAEEENEQPLGNLAPELWSDYAFVEDYTTGQVLLDLNSTDRIYPASMTKMMTVLLAVEKISDYSDHFSITYNMLSGLAEANASVMGLVAGDRPTIEDLLYGAALPSGADACNALAFYVADGVTSFVDMMNEKAEEIGMYSTHFVNPTGLHDDNHYTTCKDMALLLEYGLQNDMFREIFSAGSYTTSSLMSAPEGITMWATAKSAIWNYDYDVPGFEGAKTGYTESAGHCMSYWADLNGMTLIAVTAHADTDAYYPSHIEDAQTILQKLNGWERKQLITENQVVSEITVHYRKKDETIPICTYENMVLDVPSEENIVLSSTFPTEVDAGLEEQEISGFIIGKSGNKVIYSAEVMVRIPEEKSFLGRLSLILKDLFHK